MNKIKITRTISHDALKKLEMIAKLRAIKKYKNKLNKI